MQMQIFNKLSYSSHQLALNKLAENVLQYSATYFVARKKGATNDLFQHTYNSKLKFGHMSYGG
ncbi:hypothetical protein BpHYR1_050012 [Brachionus plicatilis]|uniref:Uncharacterized protein n=1 Tax=Brachionus plicatilis TaxID=10195 RepID=A0A3M7QPQ2_BRAPC|nr:hypothetical protein BpHYR1_050012 [Brachionus plicatilis]